MCGGIIGFVCGCQADLAGTGYRGLNLKRSLLGAVVIYHIAGGGFVSLREYLAVQLDRTAVCARLHMIGGFFIAQLCGDAAVAGVQFNFVGNEFPRADCTVFTRNFNIIRINRGGNCEICRLPAENVDILVAEFTAGRQNEFDGAAVGPNLQRPFVIAKLAFGYGKIAFECKNPNRHQSQNRRL